MSRNEYKSNAPWENVIGYNRAIKIDDIIEVAGTTSVDENGNTVGSTYYDQTAFILSKIEKAIKHFGASRNNIIRTRIYVLDMGEWHDVAKAHLEFFNELKPVNTLIEVSRFIQPDLLVEIEANAIINI